MGYYTAFDIIVSYPDGVQINPKSPLAKSIDAAIDALDLSDFCGTFPSYQAYDKWSDNDKDMIGLSKQFPDVLFTVYGDGEDSEDFWVTYYYDGKAQWETAEIVYPEFDMKKLKAGV